MIFRAFFRARPCDCRFLRDRRGVAAVEFALVGTFILLPLMVGLVAIMTLFRADTKLAAFAINTGQMVSVTQSVKSGVSTISAPAVNGSSSLQDVCQGAVQGLGPFPANGMTVDIASVTLESGPSGTTGTTVHTNNNTFDMFEQDFSVSGATCTPNGNTDIGAAQAENYAMSSPPSLSGAAGANGLVEVPCDNVLIVRAVMNYPGIVGAVFGNNAKLTQLASTRWRPASISTELECAGCTLTQNATTQLCNTSNTGN
ncbi:TadE/TadG family type IV pilus assembly protein [Acidocella sp.]|uniref:TadE/TadG family type IV pilus assembly protein n=1 Tax=Acidocella sp. TaxID=50710 RepID=UPI00263937B9|nr:hypothetical protein [Acidocella sp.]